jgi:hypothetical protein
MGTKSREVIYRNRIGAARINAEWTRKAANAAIRAADRAECEAWSLQMTAYGGPAQPSPTIAQCLNGGYGFLEVKCQRCETIASVPLEFVRRTPDTPIWKLEASLSCRQCKPFTRWPPKVHMIKLTERQDAGRYRWHHPGEES